MRPALLAPGVKRQPSPSDVAEAGRHLARGLIDDERPAPLPGIHQPVALAVERLAHGAGAHAELARQIELVGQRRSGRPGAADNPLRQPAAPGSQRVMLDGNSNGTHARLQRQSQPFPKHLEPSLATVRSRNSMNCNAAKWRPLQIAVRGQRTSPSTRWRNAPVQAWRQTAASPSKIGSRRRHSDRLARSTPAAAGG